MSTNDKIKEIIRRLIRKEIEEASMTGNLDGGEGPPKTPYAFQTKPKSKKDKKKEKAITTAGGYMKVDETKFHVKVDGLGDVIVNAGSKAEAKMMVAKQLKNRKDVTSVARVQTSKAKQIDQRLESVNEGQYHNYRNDESMTAKQKIGLSMREVRDKLNELDKLVKINV